MSTPPGPSVPAHGAALVSPTAGPHEMTAPLPQPGPTSGPPGHAATSGAAGYMSSTSGPSGHAPPTSGAATDGPADHPPTSGAPVSGPVGHPPTSGVPHPAPVPYQPVSGASYGQVGGPGPYGTGAQPHGPAAYPQPGGHGAPPPYPGPAASPAWSRSGSQLPGVAAPYQGPLAMPGAEPTAGRNRVAIVVAVVAVLVALAAVIGVGLLVLDRRAAPPTEPTTPSLGAVGPPPGNLTMRDDTTTITLTWTDPSDGLVPFMVAGGRTGQSLGMMATVDPGRTSYTVNGLSTLVNYCFAVLAVYDTDQFATSDQVCTSR
ncbi:fibronectin type III domain-containing protein [Verrucosispora sp. WMMC514]|uniref:fibronectin type III domain-containing protein n=1 Tax=Verrucosispora sp. WMMC514 TaxID=3015156 RepID=UPI00248BD61F|nr:fibronectin type III domain-containing protein [Verrucosispora sp. WMMC514]WBB94699.1 hypothetical protein O7597_00480 [Verrucosispora sp. WMMC514]